MGLALQMQWLTWLMIKTQVHEFSNFPDFFLATEEKPDDKL